MSQISVYAPIKGPEGYSLLARDLIKQLGNRGVHVCLEEFQGWGPWEVALSADSHQSLSTALSNQLYASDKAIPHLNICLPEQVRIRENQRNLIYTMFEGDSIPDSWVQYLEQMDEVLVPTEFNRWSFSHKNDLPSDMITALPIGIDLERYNPNIKPLYVKPKVGKRPMDFDIRFLVVCEVTNRKNFWGAMQLWFRTASCIGPENICVVLKVGNYSKLTSIAEDVRKFQAQLVEQGMILDRHYNVFMYQPLLSEEHHPHFVKLGTHYLSTSFGEGWDLTALQAAACGLHVMVPCHSAYQCWLTQEVATMFPVVRKVPCQQAGGTQRLYDGMHWSALDLDAAAEMTFSSLLDPSITNLKRAAMQEHIKNYSWDNAIDQYLNVLF